MSKKFTLEETQDIFSKFGLTILENEAKGIDYKYTCIDSDGYLYKRSTHSIQTCIKRNISGFSHIFSTKNPYFYENMIHYIQNNVKIGTILLTKKEEIENIDQRLTFRCGLCGREYSSTWHVFVKNTDKVCNICFKTRKANGETNTKSTKDYQKFYDKARKSGLCILNGGQITWHEKVLVQDKDGYRGLIAPATIMADSLFDRFSVSNPYTIDNLRLYAFNRGWDCIICNQEYKGNKTPFKVICHCGNEFSVDVNHFKEGKFQCNECRVKQSYISMKVERYINELKISYEKEKSFNDCRNINPLPFDFYLDSYRALIEVDGLGHYRPVAFNGDKEAAKINYENRVFNDNIKTKYCKANNIPLLRLPYWIIENSEEYKSKIDEFINNLSTRSNDSSK